MKRILCIALSLISLNAMAQGKVLTGILDRFDDPDKGKVVFIEKGNRSIGISGSYRNFSAGGTSDADGYAILSMLNIGKGTFQMWHVAPSFSYFLANDLSLGLRLDYSGYLLDTNLKLDLRELLGVENPEEQESLNIQISGRHMIRHAWGASLALRKYLSFFGSKTFAVFGEARLYGNYGLVNSCAVDKMGVYKEDKMRTSGVLSTGLKFGAGLCVRLRDSSALTVCIPIAGVTYSYTKQHKVNTGNEASMSQFGISRDIEKLGIQIGYCRYLKSKKKR